MEGNMKWHYGRVARRELDNQLKALRPIAPLRPPKGWVRAIRDSLGMSSAQLGARLGVTSPSVVELEQREASGSISLATLRRAAEALDCTVVYALVPNRTLEETVREQARKVAAKRLSQVSHTMELEAQGINAEDKQAQYEELVESLVRENPRAIWAER